MVLIAGLLGTNLVVAQRPTSSLPTIPGMVSYTYRQSFQRNMAATLDTIRAMGIVDMEFSNLFGKTTAEIRRLLDERGMHCSSFGVSYADALTKIDEVGQNAKILGAQYVRIAWIPHEGPFTQTLAQQVATDFNKIGKQLKERYALTFCYHNHGNEFQPSPDGTLFDYIVKNTNPQYVNFELDILWVILAGYDPVDLLKKYGSRFQLMHLKDLRKGVTGNLSGNTSTDNDVALGTGQANLPAIIKAAQQAGIRHYYIEDESQHVNLQVPQSILYWKSLRQE